MKILFPQENLLGAYVIADRDTKKENVISWQLKEKNLVPHIDLYGYAYVEAVIVNIKVKMTGRDPVRIGERFGSSGFSRNRHELFPGV